MAARQLPYPVFDADNHFYEPKEALTQFLPERRKGVIDYIDVRGRTKIMVRNVVSDYIPNPTFEVVARPGAQEEYFRHGSGGKSYREVVGKPMKAIPAFRNPEARLEVMDSLGLDYTLMFPTLASLVEERLKDDPDLILDIVHALNEWMYETWQFNYQDRIFSTPVINLGVVDRALEELQWCLERGAKTVLVRPAPVPGYRGTRSLGMEEFDPFWDACVKAGIPVSMHASDSGYSEYLNDWEPGDEFKPFAPTAFRMVAMGKRPIEDTMAALVCHGALTRNPDLRVLSIENGADWVPYLFKQFKSVYSKMPQGFLEDPIEAFHRCVYVAPFWEDDFAQMADLLGIDRVIFGSDWPHPEGLAQPTHLIDDLAGLDAEGQRKVMGGNMIDLFKIPNEIVHKPGVPALEFA
jgi:predicted TIM-barrel fold metal-dependent hydrolase